MEKMIIKHGDLRGTFIADQKHAFQPFTGLPALLAWTLLCSPL